MTAATLYAALLNETRQNSLCKIHEVVAKSRACRSVVVESLLKLQEVGALTLADEEIRVRPEQRLRIAELAITAGADPERVARELRWQEFESFADQVLMRSGFATMNRLVFKSSDGRHEIDVLGAKEPVVLCIDCKHWHHGWAPSKILSAARNQLVRVLSLSSVFTVYGRKLCAGWQSVHLLPVVLTLADVSSRLMGGVPIVSAFRFRSFLSEMSLWIGEMRFVDASVEEPSKGLFVETGKIHRTRFIYGE